MKKSLSTPGLMALGTSGPKLGNSHHRKVTLGFKDSHKGVVDFARKTACSEDVASLAETIRRDPSWRLQATDRPMTPTAVEDCMPKNMVQPRNAPAWLKHDKQVLRFYGFYQETVTERPDENSRFRYLVITYHMEDGTLMIGEPRVENSGISQGQFLKRMRVPREDQQGFLGPDDFRCGQPIEIFAKVIHITGVDRFTRWFYEENGIDVGEDEPVMQDQWQKSYRFMKTAEKGGLPLSRSAVDAKTLTKYMVGQPAQPKATQFLLNDRKVLCFKAYWDDPTPYGARLYFTIHFFLADNSVEINEAHARNSGRDCYPVFYKRGPLYKSNSLTAYPGMLKPDPIAYEPNDFVVGEDLTVYRRKIVLYDCDEFTRNFYLDYNGADQWKGKISVQQPPVRHVKLPPPPHNGIGSEEDSLINCEMIRPVAPKKDLVKMMTLSGEVLRFEALMTNGEPEDSNRKFVISFYPADGEVMVCEIQERNNGHMAGKFAEKKLIKNPDTGKYFKIQDFYVGQTVTVASQPLTITRADEHCLQYLEEHCEIYPLADTREIAKRIAPLASHPEMTDSRGISPDRLKKLASEAHCDLIDHEVITLLRKFCVSPDGDALIDGAAVLQMC